MTAFQALVDKDIDGLPLDSEEDDRDLESEVDFTFVQQRPLSSKSMLLA